MTLLLDTRTLAAWMRIEAANAALSSTEIPAIFHYGTSEGPVGHRFDYWDLGQGSHVTRIMGSALGITRGPKQVRAAAPERIGLGFELRTATGFTHLDVDQVVEPGEPVPDRRDKHLWGVLARRGGHQAGADRL